MEDVNTNEVVNEEVKETTETATGQNAEDKQENTFTQEDVNNIVAKNKKEAQEKLLKDLGIEDFENAKDGLAKFREWQESQKTEAEKNAEKMQTLEKENADYKANITRLEATNEALKQGVNAESVDDVILLASKDVNDEVTYQEAIKGVLEKYPQFGKQEEIETNKPKIINPKNNVNKGEKSNPWADVAQRYK